MGFFSIFICMPQKLSPCTSFNLIHMKLHRLFILLCTLLSFQARSQNPCTGAPSPNTIVPASPTVCAGASFSLGLLNSYTNSGISYQWQSSTVSPVGPFASIAGATMSALSNATILPSTYFNVIITCTNSGLSISVTTSVAVVPCNTPCSGTPASNTIIPSTQSLCAGSSVSLSLVNTYTNTGLTYQWFSSTTQAGPFIGILGATQVNFVSPPLNTSIYYGVIITCTNSNQTFSTTQAIAVNNCTNCFGAPAVNSVVPASQTVCIGSSVSLSLANTFTGTGISYQWQSSTVSPVGPFSSIPGATLANYNSPQLNTPVFYNVIITCTASGLSINASAAVYLVFCNSPCTGTPASNTIVPLSQTICAGSQASLTLANSFSVSGLSYQWYSSSVIAGPYAAITGATLNSLVSPTLSADEFYNLVITCTNSAQSTTLSAQVAVMNCSPCIGIPGTNTIVPTNSVVCYGSPAILGLAQSYTNPAVTYQWQSGTISPVGPFTSINSATLSTLVSPTLYVSTYFNVIITCTSSGASFSTSQMINVVPCVGISEWEQKENQFRIIPNPASELIQLVFRVPVNGVLEVMDLSSRLVYRSEISGHAFELNLREWSKGLYFLKFSDQKGTQTLKLIKD